MALFHMIPPGDATAPMSPGRAELLPPEEHHC
jgi:hypothetical protein